LSTKLNEQLMNRLLELTTGSGKFEGEPPMTPHYWEEATTGNGESTVDNSGTTYTAFKLTTEEKEFFRRYLTTEQDYFVVHSYDDGPSTGMIYGSAMSTEDYLDFLATTEESFEDDIWDY
jgi:hypothetical protein